MIATLHHSKMTDLLSLTRSWKSLKLTSISSMNQTSICKQHEPWTVVRRTVDSDLCSQFYAWSNQSRSLLSRDESRTFLSVPWRNSSKPTRRRAPNLYLWGKEKVMPVSQQVAVRYSPFLSIVEHCLSQWKAAIKRDLAENRGSLLLMPHNKKIWQIISFWSPNKAASS